MTTIERTEALERVDATYKQLRLAERNLDEAVTAAHTAGASIDDIAGARDVSRATLYRRLADMHQPTNPAQYHDYAPSLHLEQPANGLTIALGVDLNAPPPATFTFDRDRPVLALFERPEDTNTPSMWPVIAASAAASDARVKVYGPRPSKRWDSPTYFGDEYDRDPAVLETAISRRTRQHNIDPILVLIDYRRAFLPVVNILVHQGWQAGIFTIVRSAQLRPELGIVSSTITRYGIGNHTNFQDGEADDLLPTIPEDPLVAILNTPTTQPSRMYLAPARR